MKKRRIAILGSTGSIGTQALDVIRSLPEIFEAEVLTANSNADLLIRQAKEFKPNVVVIADESKYQYVKDALASDPVKVYTGYSALSQVTSMDTVDMVLTAMVGFSGLEPTLAAIRNKKNIALANKETLVVAGRLVSKLALENNIRILPVDSEHSAIFQCLFGEHDNEIEKIVLTASGGPFRGKSISELQKITPQQALKHPNWSMGSKITIDSATLMNKGLEMIEARWLFDLNVNQVEVIVHPQSIIHSMVQFTDGSMKAQMGLPDMKLPIQVALGFPKRFNSEFPRFDFNKYPLLTFEPADDETFKCLKLARYSMQRDGNLPCIMNAANEIAVESFLNNRLSFTGIPEVIEEVMQKVNYIDNPSEDELRMSDSESRNYASELIGGRNFVPSPTS